LFIVVEAGALAFLLVVLATTVVKIRARKKKVAMLQPTEAELQNLKDA